MIEGKARGANLLGAKFARLEFLRPCAESRSQLLGQVCMQGGEGPGSRGAIPRRFSGNSPHEAEYAYQQAIPSYPGRRNHATTHRNGDGRQPQARTLTPAAGLGWVGRKGSGRRFNGVHLSRAPRPAHRSQAVCHIAHFLLHLLTHSVGVV